MCSTRRVTNELLQEQTNRGRFVVTPLQRVKDFLNENMVPFEIIHHRRDYTAQETAADTHIKGKDFAKTVILRVENRYCMAVLPATCRIDLVKVKACLHAKSVNIASEGELETICADCEVGAMPPFGAFYGMPVIISHYLAYDHMMAFNAGTHEDVIRIQYRDYDDLVKPKVVDFTRN